MSKYKRLETPGYYKLAINSPDIHHCIIDDGYKSIDPVFDRDGWYYDRISKYSWIEYKGTAVTRGSLFTAFQYGLASEEFDNNPVEMKDLDGLLEIAKNPLFVSLRHKLKQVYKKYYWLATEFTYRDEERKRRIQRIKRFNAFRASITPYKIDNATNSNR